MCSLSSKGGGSSATVVCVIVFVGAVKAERRESDAARVLAEENKRERIGGGILPEMEGITMERYDGFCRWPLETVK
ncbi:hypothetical protein HAX54_045442 [Datura stramonium]|uniref:Uncharacterized protein n=1 Tax=Datura stramonium TaxID=4076 RepID=A0ABS8Y7E0_DATST|nr:hypothetical protein [Datura stramonium]